MSKHVVLTGVGRDRVGIVCRVAEVLYELGCNLLDSSMTLLRGEFALILMVTLPDDSSHERLQQRIHELEKELGMNIYIRELSDEELHDSGPQANPHIISVYGADKPGIVAGITKQLADCGVNITDVQTKYAGSAASPLFMMMLEVDVPPDLTTDELDRSLKKLSAALAVDVTLQALEILEL
ncbi:MAG: glycine cleavage system protein R [Terriglobales bacterium]